MQRPRSRPCLPPQYLIQDGRDGLKQKLLALGRWRDPQSRGKSCPLARVRELSFPPFLERLGKGKQSLHHPAPRLSQATRLCPVPASWSPWVFLASSTPALYPVAGVLILKPERISWAKSMTSGPEGVFLGIARRSSFAGETRAPCCQEQGTPRRADSVLQSELPISR